MFSWCEWGITHSLESTKTPLTLQVDQRKLRGENDWQLFRVNQFSVLKL